MTGNGYQFSAPIGWHVATAGRTKHATSGADLVSVTIFRLAKPYRPKLWPAVVPQLDQVAAQLAAQLSGTISIRRTIRIGGQRARSYTIGYERSGKRFVEKIAFVLAGRREYQLLCRYEREADSCGLLFASFTLT